jgi:hypothetical protein
LILSREPLSSNNAKVDMYFMIYSHLTISCHINKSAASLMGNPERLVIDQHRMTLTVPNPSYQGEASTISQVSYPHRNISNIPMFWRYIEEYVGHYTVIKAGDKFALVKLSEEARP